MEFAAASFTPSSTPASKAYSHVGRLGSSHSSGLSVRRQVRQADSFRVSVDKESRSRSSKTEQNSVGPRADTFDDVDGGLGVYVPAWSLSCRSCHDIGLRIIYPFAKHESSYVLRLLCLFPLKFKERNLESRFARLVAASYPPRIRLAALFCATFLLGFWLLLGIAMQARRLPYPIEGAIPTFHIVGLTLFFAASTSYLIPEVTSLRPRWEVMIYLVLCCVFSVPLIWTLAVSVIGHVSGTDRFALYQFKYWNDTANQGLAIVCICLLDNVYQTRTRYSWTLHLWIWVFTTAVHGVQVQIFSDDSFTSILSLEVMTVIQVFILSIVVFLGYLGRWHKEVQERVEFCIHARKADQLRTLQAAAKKKKTSPHTAVEDVISLLQRSECALLSPSLVGAGPVIETQLYLKEALRVLTSTNRLFTIQFGETAVEHRDFLDIYSTPVDGGIPTQPKVSSKGSIGDTAFPQETRQGSTTSVYSSQSPTFNFTNQAKTLPANFNLHSFGSNGLDHSHLSGSPTEPATDHSHSSSPCGQPTPANSLARFPSKAVRREHIARFKTLPLSRFGGPSIDWSFFDEGLRSGSPAEGRRTSHGIDQSGGTSLRKSEAKSSTSTPLMKSTHRSSESQETTVKTITPSHRQYRPAIRLSSQACRSQTPRSMKTVNWAGDDMSKAPNSPGRYDQLGLKIQQGIFRPPIEYLEALRAPLYKLSDASTKILMQRREWAKVIGREWMFDFFGLERTLLAENQAKGSPDNAIQGDNRSPTNLAMKPSNAFIEVGYLLLKDYMAALKQPEHVVIRFLQSIQSLYRTNPYHNYLHGAMVGHATIVLSWYLDIWNEPRRLMASYDYVTVAIAALVHDVGHPGRTNVFFVNTHDSLAVLYNDSSVLENFHSCLTFNVLACEGCNIFGALSSDEFRPIRKNIIAMILATDMSQHFELVSRFRIRKSSPDFDYHTNAEDMWIALRMCIKLADLGHSMVDWESHLNWGLRVSEEFYQQGDDEARLGVSRSPLCDRKDHSSFAKSQKGFIEFVVQPFLEEIQQLKEEPIRTEITERLLSNKRRWAELAEGGFTLDIPEVARSCTTKPSYPIRLLAQAFSMSMIKQSSSNAAKTFSPTSDRFHTPPLVCAEVSERSLSAAGSTLDLQSVEEDQPKEKTLWAEIKHKRAPSLLWMWQSVDTSSALSIDKSYEPLKDLAAWQFSSSSLQPSYQSEGGSAVDTTSTRKKRASQGMPPRDEQKAKKWAGVRSLRSESTSSDSPGDFAPLTARTPRRYSSQLESVGGCSRSEIPRNRTSLSLSDAFAFARRRSRRCSSAPLHSGSRVSKGSRSAWIGVSSEMSMNTAGSQTDRTFCTMSASTRYRVPRETAGHSSGSVARSADRVFSARCANELPGYGYDAAKGKSLNAGLDGRVSMNSRQSSAKPPLVLYSSAAPVVAQWGIGCAETMACSQSDRTLGDDSASGWPTFQPTDGTTLGWSIEYHVLR